MCGCSSGMQAVVIKNLLIFTYRHPKDLRDVIKNVSNRERAAGIFFLFCFLFHKHLSALPSGNSFAVKVLWLDYTAGWPC